MYQEQGYDCIPLRPLSKVPLKPGWQRSSPFRQWNNAPDNVNIGLRAGFGKAFIDCDTKNDPQTTDNVIRWLGGLGVSNFPLVRTPSGGSHIYIAFNGAMLGSSRKLSKAFGAGEFRFSSGAQVAAPPSVIPEGEYRLIQGDTANLPSLDMRDITALVNVGEATPDRKEPRMSPKAAALAMGQGLENYASRSEAEAALVLSLINSGYEYPEIKRVFDNSPVFGKYAELRTQSAQRAEYWLQHTFDSAKTYSQNESPVRRKLREIQELAGKAAWQRATDKLVFLAHTQIAFNAGRFEYAASTRDLALLAGLASNRTAAKANHRLMGEGLLSLREQHTATLSNRYVFDVDKSTHFLTFKYLGSVYVCPSQVAENGLVLDLEGLEVCDAFRNGRGRLGRRAAQVYKMLFTDSLTSSELAERTGASLKTIRRTLAKLSRIIDHKTGEVIEMVTQGDDGKWHSKVVDIELIEAIYGTRGASARQRNQYEIERRDHARSLERTQRIEQAV